MTAKFLYLEDADRQEIEPFVQAVDLSQRTEIVLKHPSHYQDSFDKLIEDLQEYDGIILDWRLDEIVMGAEQRRYPFRAGALAQELHSRSSEGMVRSIPIILWSATRNFHDFRDDYTAQDLFDRVYTKEYIADHGDRVSLELAAVTRGYDAIRRNREREEGICALLQCQEHPEFLDLRVRERFSVGKRSVYELAHFILFEMLDRPGPLIGEELLAARLGVDKKQSPDWNALKQRLDIFRYKGPFASAWQRWWSYGVTEQWWFSDAKAEYPLSALTASERIEIISRFTGLTGLIPASPGKQGYHDRFYVICEETRIPLDPIDGVIIDEPHPEPWQERRYISLDVALMYKSQQYRPHPTELERLRMIAQE